MKFTENTELLQTVFDSASNGIAVMQPVYNGKGRVEDFSILLFNKYTLNWIGDIDYKGKRYGDVFPMVKETGILEKFIEVAEAGVTANFERWYDGEGMNHWFCFTAVRQGELLVVTTEDITERKQTEIALNKTLHDAEKQKRLYDSITNNTPDLVYVFDPAYHFTYANKALLAMWGKTAEEAIGKGLRENGYEEWHAQMHEREIDEIVATKKSIRGTVSFPHAELGSRVYDYILVPVINEKGEVEAIAGTTRDITEIKLAEKKLQQSEIRLKTMIDQTPAPTLVLMGDDLVVEQINTSMLQMIGRGEEVIGLPLITSMPELEGQYVWDQVLQVYREGKSFDEWEVPVSHKRHGVMQDYFYNIAYRPLKEDGRITGMIQVAIDVTEQVVARKKLEESEARFRGLLQEAPMAATLFRGPELVIEIANELTLKYWGKNKSIIGKPVAEAAPELEDQQLIALLKDVYQKGGTVSFSETPITFIEDGVLKHGYYSFSVKALHDSNGNVERILSVGVDVTEQVAARKKLEESESRFRAFVNASSDVVYSMNADWTVMRHLEGRGFLSDTGEPIPDWIKKYIHPADQQPVKKAIAAAIAGKTIFQMEHRVLNADGALGWTYSRAIPILDDEDNIMEWFGAATDITSQKQVQEIIKASEEDLRNLVLQSPTGICVIDANTLINEIVNDKFVEIAGKPYEAIMGKQHWDTFSEAAPYYEAALQGVINTGRAYYANEVELMLIRHGKEEIVYVTFVYEPMKDPGGAVKKVVVWVVENTVQVQARQKVEESENRYRILSETLEQQVNERTKELQRSNEDLQQFAHVASHDLREPIRKIKTFTTRLEEQLDGKLDEPATRFFKKIQGATDRMFTMIDGVLTYSTTNAALQTPQPVDLNDVMKNIETDLEMIIQKTGTDIQYAPLPVIEGAPVLIYQLFYNLVNNSIKFAKTGVPPRITITSELVPDHNKPMIKLVLSDNGIGFEKEHAGPIFDTFIRLNSKDKYEGTGLGLALCKKIVERHGGSISATGATGVGATFTILLPVKQNDKNI